MIKLIANQLGYEEVKPNVFFHFETNRTVTVLEHRVIITEEVDVENDAQIIHILTCNAGMLDNAYLTKIDENWSFTTDEQLQEEFAMVAIHGPTMNIYIPIRQKKVSYANYENGNFIEALAKDTCVECGFEIANCEVKVLPTELERLSIVLITSIDERICLQNGIYAGDLLKMESVEIRQKAIISQLQLCLGIHPQQPEDTSKHEESHLVH